MKWMIGMIGIRRISFLKVWDEFGCLEKIKVWYDGGVYIYYARLTELHCVGYLIVIISIGRNIKHSCLFSKQIFHHFNIYNR